MLTKFETKSARVKSVALHPKRPWVLAALLNGSIQLWDYKLGSMVDRFDEHEGPVRGVSFHQSQPLFVSCGDDYKIKLWNWKQRRCIHTFNGHLDYIRSVSFHSELPWIISASDDQTIRIWNWQSRTCISILTGHSHYVMSAEFHPKEDLIVSASLDQTVRVWDISGAPIIEETRGPGGQADVFGNMDAIVKFVLEGHSRGINYASFHPTLPLIISCGDDRLVKLWRMNDSKAWEVDTCRGHFNNVTSALFHPRQDLIVSTAEDKTVRVWDMTKRTSLQTHRREGDRFWCLALHPELNLFAAGHDSGLMVFKFERERPAHVVTPEYAFYVKDKFIRAYNFATANDIPMMAIRRGPVGQFLPHKTMSYNPAEHSVILCSANDGGTYEIYSLPKDPGSTSEGEARRGSGSSAIFVARNRFAVLEKGQIYIKDLGNNVTKHLKPTEDVHEIFYAGGKNLLLSTPTSVILYDTESRSAVADIGIAGVRYVVWSHDQSQIACFSKHNIVIANKKLEQSCIIHETIKIKSGVWDEAGIFVYTTLNHIKYAIPNGDTGIIKTIEHPLYVTRVKGSTIHCLDRLGKVRAITFDPTEYLFKLALIAHDYDKVFHIIRTSNLVGQSIIGYLQKKGYPEIALQFVKDPKTRYDLALESGNIEAALEMAKVIELPEYWSKLGVEALKQGNQSVVEYVYQRTKSFEKLSFLYLITGNKPKLQKMLKIAQHRDDIMSAYQNALFLGDINTQVELLNNAGQLPLAYLTAKTYGLEEDADAIVRGAGLESHPPILQNAKLLVPKHPINHDSESNWPLLDVSGTSKAIAANHVPVESIKPIAVQTKNISPVVQVPDETEETGDWGDELEIDLSPLKSAPIQDENEQFAVEAEDGWDIDAELDIPVSAVSPKQKESVIKSFVAPPRGPIVTTAWLRNSQLAADHIAAGSFESAMQLLNRQIGVFNFLPLKGHFMALYQASKAYLSATSGTSPLSCYLTRTTEISLPFGIFTLDSLKAQVQNAFKSMSQNNLQDAQQQFQSIIQQSILIVAKNQSEVDQIKQIIITCREYLLGIHLETTRRSTEDQKRALELAAYFTHCKLEPTHLQLSLRLAMVNSFKAKNYATSLSFAQRLLDLSPAPNVAQSASKIVSHCERNAVDAVNLDYDQYNPFSVCGYSFTPIYQGSTSVSCPLCASVYLPEYSGQCCKVCDLSKIGAPCSGLNLL